MVHKITNQISRNDEARIRILIEMEQICITHMNIKLENNRMHMKVTKKYLTKKNVKKGKSHLPNSCLLITGLSC